MEVSRVCAFDTLFWLEHCYLISVLALLNSTAVEEAALRRARKYAVYVEYVCIHLALAL
jgi:hypothetical protein